MGQKKAAHRAAALAETLNLPLWPASSLIIVGWATATRAGVVDAVRLIDAEITALDKEATNVAYRRAVRLINKLAH